MRSLAATLRGRRGLAGGLGTLAVLEVVVAVASSLARGWTWAETLESFVATNSAMGASFAICGALVAWHRPKNPIGWLFIADGLGHATSAMIPPIVTLVHDHGGSVGLERTLVTVFVWSWPWSVGLFLPLALLLFPSGQLLSRRWRPVAIGLIATAPLFVMPMTLGPHPAGEDLPNPYFTLPVYDSLQPLWTVGEIRSQIVLLLALWALIWRYRKGSEEQRRQLLWLVLAVLIVVVVLVPWGFISGTPVAVLFAIPLIPAAVAVAILRHRLFDIKLVVSRALTWLGLSAVVIGAYVGLVAVLDRIVSEQVGRSAVATIVLALLVAPLLPRLQRLVDRALYGDRRDPVGVVSRVGQELVARTDSGLEGVAASVRTALRLPYVAIRGAELLAVDGDPTAPQRSVPLVYGGQTVGELHVGLRAGQGELGAADRNVLTLLATPLAVAVHAMQLADEVQSSRERIVAAREEERRRLRRDLHDGLGPTLTGAVLAADAAANLLTRDPDRSYELIESTRADVRTAIADVRRLVDDLRPPALDELGLVDALRHRAETLAWRADGAAVDVQLEFPPHVPALPAAIEVAAYRIATEALTNVVRHSQASSAVLRLRCGDSLDIEILDDGQPDGAWRPGVGLHAMRERAAELGGIFEAGPSADGGRVFASLPLGVK
jgi:signal transduction histidine kinase